MPKLSSLPGAHDQVASLNSTLLRIMAITALACIVATATVWAGAPRTERLPVRDTYHGVSVTGLTFETLVARHKTTSHARTSTASSNVTPFEMNSGDSGVRSMFTTTASSTRVESFSR